MQTPISLGESTREAFAGARTRWQDYRRGRRLRFEARVSIVILVLVLLIVVTAPILPLADPLAQNLSAGFQDPSRTHLLGTDQLGRDLLARLIWGTRTTVLAAALGTIVAVCIGVPAALLAAYRRGAVDILFGRAADLTLILPGLVVLLAAQAALQSGIYVSLAILGVLLAPQVFRVTRAAALAVARAPFVQAGRLSGASQRRIVSRYLLPNVAGQIAVQISFVFGYALLAEAGLSFLGVGVQPPQPSLGTLMGDGTVVMGRYPRMVIIPGVVLTLLILACNLVGDAIADRTKA